MEDMEKVIGIVSSLTYTFATIFVSSFYLKRHSDIALSKLELYDESMPTFFFPFVSSSRFFLFKSDRQLKLELLFTFTFSFAETTAASELMN